MADARGGGSDARWFALMPFVFVLLWSTGFIVAKYAAPHAPPLTFLLYRFAGVIVVLLPLAWLTRAPWPRTRRAWLDIAIVGVLLQATYLGGVWAAIALGMPAGVSSLLVGTQPLLTAVFGFTVGERVKRLQWLGLLLGLAGIGLVLSDRLTLAGVGPLALGVNLLALVGITAGTLYQKKHGAGVDLRTGSIIQFGASFVVLLPFALAFETLAVDHNARVLARARVVDRRAVAGRDFTAAGYDPARSCHPGGEPDVPDAGDDGIARVAGLRRAAGRRRLGRRAGHDDRSGAGGA